MRKTQEIELYLRRILNDVRKVGETKLHLHDIPYDEYKAAVTDIAADMHIDIECKKAKGDRILVRYIGPPVGPAKPDFSDLKAAGDSKMFDVEPAREASFRSKASTYARAHGLSSRVIREGIGRLCFILLSRADATTKTIEDVTKKAGRPRLLPSELKYPFATLAVGASVKIEAPRRDHSKIRGSASSWAIRYGWKLSCRAEDGGIRITRTS